MFWAGAIFTQDWHQVPFKGSIRIWPIFLLVLVLFFFLANFPNLFCLCISSLLQQIEVEMLKYPQEGFTLIFLGISSSTKNKNIENFTKKLVRQAKNPLVPQRYPYYEYGLTPSDMKNVGLPKCWMIYKMSGLHWSSEQKPQHMGSGTE